MSVTPCQPPRVRAARRAATRQGLLEAARRCFAERGFSDTHVAHIARAAQVAHGTFYVHFPSKPALLDVLLEDFNARLRARVGEAMAGARSLDEAALAAARAFLEACVAEAPIVRAAAERAAGGLALDAMVEGVNPPALALLEDLLAARVEPAQVELVAHGLLALWLRVALRVLFAGADLEAAASTLSVMTVGAVAALERRR
ncbi:MAG: TetR/AcrR family transcriptional regulator [Sandaracinaceae bacterium]|nr:TetR/AcrR family transcriptional regulator [Sandaracinaceae bacterium]